jgi:hypothetical protein
MAYPWNVPMLYECWGVASDSIAAARFLLEAASSLLLSFMTTIHFPGIMSPCAARKGAAKATGVARRILKNLILFTCTEDKTNLGR